MALSSLLVYVRSDCAGRAMALVLRCLPPHALQNTRRPASVLKSMGGEKVKLCLSELASYLTPRFKTPPFKSYSPPFLRLLLL